jgi:hypothetical protein
VLVIVVTRRIGRLCLPTLGLVLVAAVAARTAQASTIHACVKPKSGATRIVSGKAKCHHGEQRMSWNTSGPAGPRGQAGAPGTSGPQGTEGKAGTNGAGALFSAVGGEVPVPEAGVVAATKTIPPGSYMVWANSQMDSSSSAAGLGESFCILFDRPGTTNTGEGTIVDVSSWEDELGQHEPADFSAEATIPLQGPVTSQATSTLAVSCFAVDDSPGVTVRAVLTQLQALTVTSVG